MRLPKIVCVVGATAAGKTSLGIEIAKVFDGEVISVDSRQVYRGMSIGTAKPEGVWEEDSIEIGSVDQLFGARKRFVVEGVVHWGIDLVDPDEEYSVSQFKDYAEEKIADIVARGKLPILVGGTGLWVQAVVENLDLASVPADPDLRAELDQKRLGDLFHEYKQLDPEGAESIDRKNKRRLVRALEVTKVTGVPFSQQRSRGERQYDVLQIGVKVDREALYERINHRVDVMIAQGLVDEVRGLKNQYGCEIPSMTGIGYRQLCGFLEGEEKLSDAIEELKRDTRHYAKRQLSWFRRDESIVWVEDQERALELVRQWM